MVYPPRNPRAHVGWDASVNDMSDNQVAIVFCGVAIVLFAGIIVTIVAAALQCGGG